MAITDEVHPGCWIDLSRPLAPGRVRVWDGDQEFSVIQKRQPRQVLSSFATTCHVGTHVDAPMHLDATAAAMEDIPLDRFIGRAEVVRLREKAAVIDLEALPAAWTPRAPRILFRTDSHPVGAAIGPGFSALAPALAPWLGERGVLLVGLDTPSFDPFESRELLCHRALMRAGITWIEGLCLEAVEAGVYDMIALPLPLVGVEGAPVRVVVRPSAGEREGEIT